MIQTIYHLPWMCPFTLSIFLLLSLVQQIQTWVIIPFPQNLNFYWNDLLRSWSDMRDYKSALTCIILPSLPPVPGSWRCCCRCRASPACTPSPAPAAAQASTAQVSHTLYSYPICIYSHRTFANVFTVKARTISYLFWKPTGSFTLSIKMQW